MAKDEIMLDYVRRLEDEYGSVLEADRQDSELFKKLRVHIDSKPVEKSWDRQPLIDFEQIQQLLDEGYNKGVIEKMTSISTKSIRNYIRSGKLSDEVWKKARARIKYKVNQEKLDRIRKEMGL